MPFLYKYRVCFCEDVLKLRTPDEESWLLVGCLDFVLHTSPPSVRLAPQTGTGNHRAEHAQAEFQLIKRSLVLVGL